MSGKLPFGKDVEVPINSSGTQDSAGLVVGLNDPKSLFQPK